jgi:magnesium-transporting ATPase (P-type)
MTTRKDLNAYNPFYIEPNKLESEDLADQLIDNNEHINIVSTHNSASPAKPSNTVKTRKRGYSLRTQLLNTNIHKQSEQYLEQHDPILNQSTVRFANDGSPTEDIELKSVQNAYNPNDLTFVRNNEEDNDEINGNNTNGDIRYNTLLTNESIIDINDDFLHVNDFTLNSKKGKIGLTSDDSKIKRFFSLKKNNSSKSTTFFKKLYLLLSGGRAELPSIGGRRIQITINLENTDLPKIKNKKNQTLLLDERNNRPYVNNLITSSRYTIASFLPRQLIAQFSKLANCYFMMIAIFQLIPSWSTTGTSTTIIPLCIFISISMIREAWDDVRRHKLDKEENNRITKVLKELQTPNSLFESDMRFSKSTSSFSRLRPSGQSFDFNFEDDLELENKSEELNSFEDEKLLDGLGISTIKTKWKDLKIGDIVKLECDEWVPADMILLTSSNEMGETFVETMALDGETNLKSRLPNIEINKLANKAKNLFNLSGTIVSEDPNIDLYNYEGSLDLPNLQTQQMQTYPLGPDNIIYRGSIIRNTESCLGIIIFTGEETKIRMNAIKNPRIKAPKLQRKINMIVIFMVFLVITLSLFSFMGERILYDKYKDKNWYIANTNVGVVPTIMGYIIMFNTMIPLSLYVTMEIIKLVQMQLLQSDIDMYHQPSDTPAEARTATILEELGQVSYVFSDKTGTLTDNMMLFRKFSVCGVPWVHDIDLLIRKEDHSDPNDLTDVFSNNEEKPGAVITASRPSMASLNLENPKKLEEKNNLSSYSEIKSSLEFIKYIQLNPNTLFSKKASFFLLSIALCHTCLPRKIKNNETEDQDSIDSLSHANFIEGNNNSEGSNLFDKTKNLRSITENKNNDDENEKIEYQAASPDELALVQAACDMGFILFDKKQKMVTLKTYPDGFNEEPEFNEYEILDVIEFSSSRKRMSVIVKFPSNKIMLFCKGADNIIMERLVNTNLVSNAKTEVSKSVSQRRKAEAEFILNKRSIDKISSPKSSFTSDRLSLSISRNNNNEEMYENINSLLDSDDTNQIFQQSKRSIDLEDMKKYNLLKHQYIPPNNLLLDDKFIIERTLRHIDEFSSDGLRTLLYSYRELNDNDYQEWSKRYADAKTSLINRLEKIEKIGEEFENQLILLGCTAIEDKLQDGVPEAIEKLRRAGIKMWMLTGDKRETAINIGYSCKLIKDYSSVIILSNEFKDDGLNVIDRLTSIITSTEIELDDGNIAHCVIVVDGSTLTDIESDLTLLTLFISLGVKANSVIVCRASPSQKAKMVSKVRELDKTKVTLAIGDGANDIAMIQSADVGVGITGKEGLQAARTSDYSIAQFRYLLKLLLVHGRYNYIRTSKFVLCTFYKELLFYLSQLIYQRYTLFTGSSLYESWSLSMFNTLFTSLPVLCIGMIDKDLNPSTLIAIPELYSKGISNETFNLPIFILWVLLATSQSVTLTFTVFEIYGFPALIDNTTYPLGVILFTTLIIIINTKLNIIEMHSINKISIISWIVSVFGWIVWCMLLVGLYKTKINTIFYVQNGLFEHFGKDFTFWASILVLIVIGIWIDFIFYFIIHLFKTTDTEKFQLFEKDPILKRKMEIASYNELKQGWLWLHDSQVRDLNNELNLNNNDSNNKIKNKILDLRSILRKGSIHASKSTQNRKRKGTMVNPNELPPNFPTIVPINSNDIYVEEMLPSGEIVKIPKNLNNEENIQNRTYRKFFKNNNKDKKNDEGDDEDYPDTRFEEFNNHNIDEILRNRKLGLDEYEEYNRQ